jgi:hypothetical protein
MDSGKDAPTMSASAIISVHLIEEYGMVQAMIDCYHSPIFFRWISALLT